MFSLFCMLCCFYFSCYFILFYFLQRVYAFIVDSMSEGKMVGLGSYPITAFQCIRWLSFSQKTSPLFLFFSFHILPLKESQRNHEIGMVANALGELPRPCLA